MTFNNASSPKSNPFQTIVDGSKVPAAMALLFVLATTALLAKKSKTKASKDAVCPIEANTSAMKRISAFAKNAAAKTETKNAKMLASMKAEMEGMDGRLTDVEMKQEEQGRQLSGLTHQVNNLQTVVADTVSVVRDDHDTLKWLVQTVKGICNSIMDLCLYGRKVEEETAALRNDVDRNGGGIRALATAIALFGTIFSWYVYQQMEE